MWERMTIDEYADLETAGGERLVKIDGVWWRRIRPFFYQPLFPLQEIVPHSAAVPREAIIGGYQHLVPEQGMANSARHLLVYDNVREYTLETTKKTRRNEIRKGLRNFTFRRIEDIDEFITAGHRIYLSFYERTRYRYKKERVEKKYFAEWARTLFAFPKIFIMGAYDEAGVLSAVDITYLVRNILFEATFFSDTPSLKKRVADATIHTLREKAAACTGIDLIYKGAVSGVTALDISKMIRGCKMISKPAFYKLNPLANMLIKTFMKQNHNKLIGALEGEVREQQEQQLREKND